MKEIIEVTSINSETGKEAAFLEENLGIHLTQDVAEKIKNLILKPNPSLSEIPFLCFITQNKIDSLLFINEFPDTVEKEFQYTRHVHTIQLVDLFTEMNKRGYRKESLVLGHLHPSGQAVIGDVKYIVDPNDWLLEPSADSYDNGLLSGGDLSFYKNFASMNPTLNLDYVAIAANTNSGPKLRIYAYKDILLVKSFKDLNSISKSTFNLS